MVKSFRDLEVWRKAHVLAKEVYRATDRFPRSYSFDVTQQLRRAALSVPTNLAEGCASSYSKELIQFVNIAKRSVSETQYLLLFAHEQDLLKPEEFEQFHERYEEINRMLGGLQRSLNGRRAADGFARHSSLATRH